MSGRPIDLFLSRLQNVSETPTRYRATCPNHDDRTPSLSVTEGQDERVLLTCHAGCPVGAVCRALGLTERDMFAVRGDGGQPSQTAARDWTAESESFIADLTEKELHRLATNLGVAPSALEGIGVGRDQANSRYTFPERDGEKRIIGIGTRRLDGGRKSFIKGGHRGLVIPKDFDELSGTVLIVEGPSDTAAARTVGLRAVGRPSAKSGEADLARLLADQGDVIVVGERDQKNGGTWPGRDGAESLARALARRWNRPVRWALPPDGIKDLRDWVGSKRIDVFDQSTCDACGRQILAELTSAASEVTPTDENPPSNGNNLANGEPKRSQADLMVELFESRESNKLVDLFHTPDDRTGYGTVVVDGHRETSPIKSGGFRHWLSWQFYKRYGKVPGSQATADTLSVISGKAIYDGPTREVSVRLAEHAGDIWLDLGNHEHQAVQITAEGWRIVPSDAVPVRFVRKPGMLPLPTPVSDGSIKELRSLVNLPDDNAWVLFVAWLVSAMRPRGPYWVLIVNGEQGSAKSTLCRFARPHRSEQVRVAPTAER